MQCNTTLFVNAGCMKAAEPDVAGPFQLDMTCYCPGSLTFQWQPYFDRLVFQNFDFFYFKVKQKLSCSIFIYLDRFMVFLFVLMTFDPILDGFFSTFRKIEKSKMADQDGRHSDMITQLRRHKT